LEDLEAYRRDFDAQPLQRLLGITLVERRAGFGRICLTRTAATPQGIGGSVHGGILAAMVDVAMLVAVFSQLRPDQQPAGTADLNITYLRPASTSRVFADARVIKHGRQLATIAVDITDDTGQLCATGRTLYAFRTGEASARTG
jgi:acyl-CoA thioesterase